MAEQLKIQGYKSLALVANGPYYKMYEGIRNHTGLHCWIQVLDAPLASQKAIVAAFESLARLRPDLQHPNILAPISFEKIENNYTIVYESFAGESVQSLIDADAPFVERRVTKIIVKTAKALQHAQLRGIKHGMLSFDFLFLSKYDDQLKVLGFGSQPIFEKLLRVTEKSIVPFFQYIPPEGLALPEQPEPCDAYALGCIYYELLSGTRPFKKAGPEELKKEKISSISPPHILNPKLSEKGSLAAMSLINPNADKRTSYGTILDQLDLKEDEIDILTDPEPQFKPTAKQRIRGFYSTLRTGGLVGSRKRVFYAVVIALVFLILVSGMFIASNMSARDEQHLQKVYAEFIAESSADSHEAVNSNLKTVHLPSSVSIGDSLDDVSERNDQLSVPIATLEEDKVQSLVDENSAEESDFIAPAELADLRITLAGDDAPESASVMMNDQYAGLLVRSQPLYLQKLDVSRIYRIKIMAAEYKSWEKSVSLSSIEENNLNVALEPATPARTIHFSSVNFADKIRIDGAVVEKLPCDIEMRTGMHRVTYIDSKSNFFWSTDVTINSQSPETINIDAANVGMGEASIVVQNPNRYGYVFVEIDDNDEQHTTPFKARLTAGWHRLRLFRQDYVLTPSDTMVFIRPFESAQIQCKVLN